MGVYKIMCAAFMDWVNINIAIGKDIYSGNKSGQNIWSLNLNYQSSNLCWQVVGCKEDHFDLIDLIG